MADLTNEQFGQLPDFAKGDYEQVGDVYRHKAEGKASALKVSLDSLDAKSRGFEQRIREIEAKSEEDRTRAEQAALDKLKKDGKFDELVADYERRAGETKKQYEDRIEKMSSRIKAAGRATLVSSIASNLNVFDKSRTIFSKLISDRIEIDPETGKESFLNSDGSASSMTLDEFIAEISGDEAYDALRDANVNRGGNANGDKGGKGGAQKVITRAAFDAYSPAERAVFIKSGGKLK